MSITGLDIFDATVQKTNQWLNEIQTRRELPTKDAAYAALRVTLHALRNRIPPQEAVAFGSQMPMLVRGFYFEGFNPTPSGWSEPCSRPSTTLSARARLTKFATCSTTSTATTSGRRPKRTTL